MQRIRYGFLPLVVATLWSNLAMSAVPQTQVQGFHLDAPLARVFPLFTAEGERSWAEGWEPEILSGAEERGSVFRTVGDTGRVTTWIVTDYRPAEGRVSYARLAQGSNMGLVDVICTANPHGGTDVSVRYTLTAVSAEGKRFVAGFLEPKQYQAMIEEWHTATATAMK
jgi:hypothetical protein